LPSLPHKNFEDGLLSAGRLSDVWLLDIDGSTTLRQGAGFTDYLALPLEFGDGVVQTGMFATRRRGGFNDGQVVFLEALSVPLAAAFEPIAMRRSTGSATGSVCARTPAT
jgi:adenylate cyclase